MSTINVGSARRVTVGMDMTEAEAAELIRSIGEATGKVNNWSSDPRHLLRLGEQLMAELGWVDGQQPRSGI